MTLDFHNRDLRRRGELADGERRPEQVNKWHGRSSGLTTDRMRVVARPEMKSASGSGETTAALPPRLGFRRREVQCKRTSGLGSSTRT
jgi:hypothetical protein